MISSGFGVASDEGNWKEEHNFLFVRRDFIGRFFLYIFFYSGLRTILLLSGALGGSVLALVADFSSF